MSSPAAQYDDNLPVKVVIIGDSGVGKTAITQRFVDDTFSETTAMSVGGKLISKAQFMGIMIILLQVETFEKLEYKTENVRKTTVFYVLLFLWRCLLFFLVKKFYFFLAAGSVIMFYDRNS